MIDWIISLFFLLSGVSALIYQVLWAKYLGLLFGNTAQAQTIVLATFLGGLAIGNAAIGRAADRTTKPLQIYGWFEVGISLFASLTPAYFQHANDLYFSLASSESASEPFFLRLVFSIAFILIPTILMGGTLPLLTKFVTTSLGQMQRKVSWLYFINSAGAACGALIAGFILIPAIGLDLSVSAAAALNATAGLGSLLLSRRGFGKKVITASEERALDQPALTKVQVRIILIAAFVSGILSLSYEISWVRLLALIMGSSAYSFSLMLSAFIAGIALGSILVEREIFPRLPSYLLFGLAEFGVFASIALTLPLYERLPYEFLKWKSIFARTPEAFLPYELMKLSFCFVLTLLPTTFLGMTLPFATRAITNSVDEVGASVGRVFSWNTLGNVSGAVLSGLYLLPILGIERLLRGGLLINGLLGVVIVMTAPATPRKLKQFTSLFAVLVMGFQIFGVPSWDKNMLSTGVFRKGALPRGITFGGYRRGFSHEKLLFYQDDSNATVTVTEYDGNKSRVLRVNGKPDASDQEDMATQVLLAQVPLFLHPQAKNALIVGLGSGVTAGAALLHPLDALVIVEISPAVKASVSQFSHVNYEVENNPKAHIHIDDALSYLKLSRKKFDIIISEPSNPWVAGVGNLFTVEFYEKAKAALNQGGLMVQWFHTYEMSDDVVRLVLRTINSVFPYLTTWNALGSEDGSGDYVIIASMDPIRPDFDAMQQRYEMESVKSNLDRIGISSFTTLLGLQTETESSIKELIDAGPVNSERFPRLEYEAPRAFFLNHGSNLLSSHDLRLRRSPNDNSYLLDYVGWRKQPIDESEYQSIFAYQAKWGYRDLLWKLLIAWGEQFPNSDLPPWYQAQMQMKSGSLGEAWNSLEKLIAREGALAKYSQPGASIRLEQIINNRSAFFFPDPAPAYELLEQAARAPITTPDSNMSDLFVKGASIAFELGDQARAEQFLSMAKAADAKNPSIGPMAMRLIYELKCESCKSLLE